MDRGNMIQDGDHELLDLESRKLCPDGACTGVIGDDGCCKLCGLPAGAEVESGRPFALPDADDLTESSASSGEELDLASRQLCPDGACTGVIGDDGRCKVCGRLGAS